MRKPKVRYYAEKSTTMFVGWQVMRKIERERRVEFIARGVTESEAKVIANALNDAWARGELNIEHEKE